MTSEISFAEYTKKAIFHELGHWIVAKNLGYKTGNIQIKIEGVGGQILT